MREPEFEHCMTRRAARFSSMETQEAPAGMVDGGRA